ncbi:uncharacterized, partial [Tachysurus ichikawai]
RRRTERLCNPNPGVPTSRAFLSTRWPLIRATPSTVMTVKGEINSDRSSILSSESRRAERKKHAALLKSCNGVFTSPGSIRWLDSAVSVEKLENCGNKIFNRHLSGERRAT